MLLPLVLLVLETSISFFIDADALVVLSYDLPLRLSLLSSLLPGLDLDLALEEDLESLLVLIALLLLLVVFLLLEEEEEACPLSDLDRCLDESKGIFKNEFCFEFISA